VAALLMKSQKKVRRHIGDHSDFLFTTSGQTQVPSYVQFAEQMLQAYNITRNNKLKIHILSNKHANISKNHVERFH
jgi:hypothetical protein